MKAFSQRLVIALVCCFTAAVLCVTNPNDADVLNQLRQGLENPELLQWPTNGDDPCGPPAWKHVFCSKSRVTQIQVQGLGLKGPLPQNLNRLSMLSNVGLQKNKFSGPLPSFSGLSNLQYAYLDYNDFDSIPADFFDGLTNVQVLALDDNNFNASTGWTFPVALRDSAQLFNFSCMSCHLVGPLPDFLGSMSSLTNLRLSDNGLSGMIPGSFKGMGLKTLWLNNQRGGGLSGQIDVVTTMESLESLWLHGNQFTGTIPETIGNLVNLKDLDLNGNKFTGVIPDSLAILPLDNLDLNNNQFMGPVPKFKAVKATYSSNSFCQSDEGVPCAPEVMVLIEFLGALNYPSRLVSDWSDNDPCGSTWLGLRCNADKKIETINLPNFNLTGELSPAVANLQSLSQIKLQSNNISGPIPENWTTLSLLKTLDLSNNNISPPVPKFVSNVDLVLNGNPLLDGSGSGRTNPSGSPSDHGIPGESTNSKSSKRSKFWAIVVSIVCVCTIILFAVPLTLYFCMKRKNGKLNFLFGVNPKGLHNSDKMVKIDVADDNTTSTYVSVTCSNTHVSTETGNNLVISVEILRRVTNDFSPENQLGHGGFGTVYKGQLEDGREIAVKRMEAGVVVSSKAVEEFQAEIRVLSKVRHRHLVSLLGYSVEDNEKLLVYEYMSQGALSKHLFDWKSLRLEPLSWKKRLTIALDVARGMEYLHNLAHRSFIHRDLKSSNILLDDQFRAKVSDFGLVKLAPDDEKSVVTRLAGTFGYLAPEYAVTGKITTKVDVFSFGVVLMELLTGLRALGEDRTEESRYLVSYFWRIKSDKQKLRAAIDKSIDITDQTLEAICAVAELAGHCTARDPSQRPDMSHTVNVLASYVEKWKPSDETEIRERDYAVPLDQMVKDWQQDGESSNSVSYIHLGDTKGSITESSMGMAKSFGSSDGR